jgi:hypothetical protein
LGKGASVSTRKAFVSLSYALIPLGLAAWIAFSLSFVFANISYLWPVISDPLGWGWNLLGTSGIEWRPYFIQVVPALQAIVLLGGLVWASITAQQIAGEIKFKALQAAPVLGFCFAVTVGLLWLLVG